MILAFCLFVLYWNPALASTGCTLTPASRQKSDAAVHYLFFDVDEKTLLSTEQPQDPTFLDYQRWVRSKTEIDPFALLQRQRQIFAKAYGAGSPTVTLFDKILDHEVGVVAPANCLSSLLLAVHNAKYPLRQQPTEFTAYIFKKSPRVKVILALAAEPWMGGPPMTGIEAESRELVAQGWQFEAALHNHPFDFDNPYGDIAGTLIPSGPDIQFHLNLQDSMGLREGWITNGFHTIRLSGSDFQVLSRCCQE
jgi:hypothetical protein